MVSSDKIKEYYKWRNQSTNPPGTYFDFMGSPIGKDECIEVAILNEHRFAFYYWIKWTNYLIEKRSVLNIPSLVTIDWHDDLHRPDEFLKSFLDDLDASDLEVVSNFAWSNLNAKNDDHILSAMYLNKINNVYVLSKQPVSDIEKKEFSFVDKYNNPHKIFRFKTIEVFEAAILTLNEEVYLDIDLDYFIITRNMFGNDGVLISYEEINKILDPNNSLFKKLYQILKGFTIAREPVWCNGLKNSNYLMDRINENLFNNTLLTQNAKWKIFGGVN